MASVFFFLCCFFFISSLIPSDFLFLFTFFLVFFFPISFSFLHFVSSVTCLLSFVFLFIQFFLVIFCIFSSSLFCSLFRILFSHSSQSSISFSSSSLFRSRFFSFLHLLYSLHLKLFHKCSLPYFFLLFPVPFPLSLVPVSPPPPTVPCYRSLPSPT